MFCIVTIVKFMSGLMLLFAARGFAGHFFHLDKHIK